jgi:hypothetical protein
MAVMSQDVPKLNPDVALSIRTMQWERSENQTRMLVLQNQYLDAQATVKRLDEELTKKLATAIKDSGLDPDRYLLDTRTLNVAPKPMLPSTPGPPRRADDAK